MAAGTSASSPWFHPVLTDAKTCSKIPLRPGKRKARQTRRRFAFPAPLPLSGSRRRPRIAYICRHSGGRTVLHRIRPTHCDPVTGIHPAVHTDGCSEALRIKTVAGVAPADRLQRPVLLCTVHVACNACTHCTLRGGRHAPHCTVELSGAVCTTRYRQHRLDKDEYLHGMPCINERCGARAMFRTAAAEG